MRRRLLFAAAALAMSAGVSPAAPRIVSMNICTDQLLLALADPRQILGLSRFSRDSRLWSPGSQHRFPILSGGAEDILVLKPDVVTASQFDKRSTRDLLKANGVNLVELPVPRSLGEVRDQIRVQPVSSFDNQLRVQLYRRIYGNGLFQRYATFVNPPIRIIVEHGNITLTGVVNSRVERATLESIARGVLAFKVDNQVQVESEIGKEAGAKTSTD